MIENGLFFQISNGNIYLGINTKEYWTATHMTSWGRCRRGSRVTDKGLEKFHWLALGSEQLVWWQDE